MTEVSAKMLHVAHRVPGMFGFRQNVEARGLVSYGVDIQDQIARAAIFVDRILRGAKPADLPRCALRCRRLF